MDLSLKIDTIEGISKKDFLKHYFYPQKPVVIKGLLNDTPAAQKWSFDYMKDKISSTMVGVFDNRRKNNSAYTFSDFKMPFSEFIDIIRRTEPCAYRLFLFNGFKHCPELKSDFPCPEIFRSVLGNMGLMFFGGQSTDVRMHFDVDMSNLLHTQFLGKKRALLFSPEYSHLLYKVPFNTYSIADFDKTDYSKFPGLRYAKGYDIILAHGDSLFMPTGYWHYMRYLEGGFAVTYRKMAHSFEPICDGLMNLTIRLWFDKLMNRLNGDYWKLYKERAAYRNPSDTIKDLQNSGQLLVNE